MIRLPVLVAVALLACAATPARAQRWVTAWAGAAQGPYPLGNAAAQPEMRFALPPGPDGRIQAHDQTFRLIVKPQIWGRAARLRFSNAFGSAPLAIDGVFLGLQSEGATLMPYSNRPVSFQGKRQVTIPPGGQVWSDAVALPYVGNPTAPELAGRKLAASFHVVGDSGPITWHAKALQTSYLTPPGAGALGELEDDSAYPNSTTGWYFLDALDMVADPSVRLVVCLGDSITDGTGSTLNGDDRWPDVLARRLRAASLRFSVVNAGIGGNQVRGPADYETHPVAGGPSALDRMERDVIGLSGVTHVIWLEGINDLGSDGGATAEQVTEAMRRGVAILREKIPGVRVFGATLTAVAGTRSEAHKGPAVAQQREALNGFIRDGGLFDGVVDFDRATVDPTTGALRAEFQPGSTTGGPGDGLHPNRAGYLAMGGAVDLGRLAAPPLRAPRPAPRRPPAAEGAGQGG